MAGTNPRFPLHTLRSKMKLKKRQGSNLRINEIKLLLGQTMKQVGVDLGILQEQRQPIIKLIYF